MAALNAGLTAPPITMGERKAQHAQLRNAGLTGTPEAWAVPAPKASAIETYKRQQADQGGLDAALIGDTAAAEDTGAAGRTGSAITDFRSQTADNLRGIDNLFGTDIFGGVADVVAPGDEALTSKAQRDEDRAAKVASGELSEAAATTGEVLDMAAGEVPAMGLTAGNAWIWGKTGAKIGEKIGGKRGKWLGATIGGLAGAISTELGSAYNESIGVAGYDPNDPALPDEVKADAITAATAKAALNSVVPFNFLRRVDPGKAADIVSKATEKLTKVGKSGTVDAGMEIATEAGEMAIDDLVMQPELMAELKASVSPEEWFPIAEYVKERYGSSDVLKQLAAAGLVGGAAGTSSSTVQVLQGSKQANDALKMSDALTPLGMTTESAEALVREEGGAANLRAAVNDIGQAETRYKLRTLDVDKLEAAGETPEAITEVRRAIKKERDDVIDFHAGTLDLPMRSEDLNWREEALKETDTKAATEKLRSLGIKDITSKDADVVEIADRLERNKHDLDHLQDRLEATTNPERRADTAVQLADAQETYRTTKINALMQLKDMPKGKAIKEVEFEERRDNQLRKRTAAVEKQLESEFPDDMPEDERRDKAQTLVDNYKDDPSVDEKNLRKKIRRLEGQRRKAANPETIDQLNDEIAALEARQGLPTPAVEAAQRVLQDLGRREPAESGADRPSDQPELAAAKDEVKDRVEPDTKPKAEAAVAPVESQKARQSEVRAGVQKGRGRVLTDLTPDVTEKVRASLVKRAQKLSKGGAPDAKAEAEFGRDLKTAGYKDRGLREELPDYARIGREGAVAIAYTANAAGGLSNDAFLTEGNVAPEDDIRREGFDDINDWRDLLDDVGQDANLEATEEALAAWTKRSGKEAAAHFAEDGTLLGVGTNDMVNGIMAPRQGFGDPTVTFTHTHPIHTPFSAADVRGMMVHTGPYRAVLPNGTVIAMRPKKLITRQTVGKRHDAIIDASDTILPVDMSAREKAVIRQEALLQHLEAAGNIEYTQPFTGLSQKEQDYVAATIEAADAELRRQRNVRAGPAPAVEPGGRDSNAAPAGPERITSPEARAKRDARNVADPKRIREVADGIYDYYSAFKGRRPRNLKKAIKEGVTRDQVRKATRVAVNGISNKSNYVLRDVAYELFPELKTDYESFFVEPSDKSTRYRGKDGKLQLTTNKEAEGKFSAAVQLVEAVGEVSENKHFMYHDPRFVKRTKSNQNFKAYHLGMNKALHDFLGYTGSPTSALMPPMDDPDDVSQVTKKKDMKMTPEQQAPGIRTARHFQRNRYTIDRVQLEKLKSADLISSKGIASKDISKKIDFPEYDRLLAKIEKTSLTRLSKVDQAFMKNKGRVIGDQLRTAEIKLKRFKESVAEHDRLYPGEPIGFQYQIDNKGRIYADGDLHPQTSDAVKKMFMVDGVSLGDMTTVDASASGWQVAGLMALDEVIAPQINLGAGQATIPGFQKQDMYVATLENLKNTIREDAARTGKMTIPQKANKALAQIALKDFVTPDKLKRDHIKTPVIAVNYAATATNFTKHFEGILAGHYGPTNVPPQLASYLGRNARAALETAAPHTMRMQNWAVDTIALVTKATEKDGINSEPANRWTVGADGDFAKLKFKKRETNIRFRASPGNEFKEKVVKEGLQAELEKDGKGDPFIKTAYNENKGTTGKPHEVHITDTSTEISTGEVDEKATARSIYSQIVQGFDASILHETVAIYKAATGDAFFTTNHDAFTAPNEHTPMAAAAAREAMYRVMKDAGDVPQRIYDDAVRNLEAAGKTPEEVGLQRPPPRGTYKMEDVLTSTPVFGETALKEDFVPVYGTLPDDGRPAPEPDVGPQLNAAIDVAQYMEQDPTARDYLNTVQTAASSPMATTARLAERAETHLTNALAPIRILEKDARGDGTIGLGMDSAFKAAEMAINDSGRNESLLWYGAGALGARGEFTTAAGTVGLRDIFKTASGGKVDGQRLQHWGEYMVARRAQELKKAGIKTPLTDVEITEALAREDTNFKNAAQMWNDYNNANLKMLKDSGRISEAQMTAMQADAFYVPFYRTDQRVDGTSPDFDMPAFNKSSKGVVLDRDPGIKAMKGGDKMRIANVFQNMVKNSQAMTAAAMRNQAANKTFDLLKDANMARVGVKADKKPHKNAVKMWKDGKESYVVPLTDDAEPAMLALAGMDPVQLGTVQRSFNNISSMFRVSITSKPSFMLNNLWRGMVQNAIMSNGANLMPTTNTLTGFTKTMKNEYGGDEQSVREFKQMSGMGDYRKGQAATGFGKDDMLVDLGLKDPTVASRFRKVLDKWESVGTATELADRIAVYDRLVLNGVPKDEAAYQALNVMNYSRKGSSETLRGWIGTLPFFNARIQGYTRVMEGAIGKNATPKTRAAALKQMAAMGAIYAMVNGLAMGWNMADEERWEEYTDLPLWRKMMALNIVMPEGMPIKVLSLPQPFEIGFLFGALPAAFMESMQPDAEETFGDAAWFVVQNTLAANLLPQAIAPIVEAVADYNFFFGSTLTARREKGLNAELRSTGADDFARAVGVDTGLSRATGLSPVMIRHWGEAYGGVLYTLMAGAFNAVAPDIGLAPPRVANMFGDGAGSHILSKAVKGFAFDSELARNKWTERYYAAGKAASEKARSFRATGDASFLEGNAGNIAATRLFNSLNTKISKLGKAERALKANMDLSPVEKRRQLIKLTTARNTIMEAAAKAMEELAEAE